MEMLITVPPNNNMTMSLATTMLDIISTLCEIWPKIAFPQNVPNVLIFDLIVRTGTINDFEY